MMSYPGVYLSDGFLQSDVFNVIVDLLSIQTFTFVFGLFFLYVWDLYGSGGCIFASQLRKSYVSMAG